MYSQKNFNTIIPKIILNIIYYKELFFIYKYNSIYINTNNEQYRNYSE
uniref:Uncharacterized protein n=1 Tax=viral metagenome TaxID=1070528 RepID=A0A6C0LFF4_9ZZZZ